MPVQLPLDDPLQNDARSALKVGKAVLADAKIVLKPLAKLVHYINKKLSKVYILKIPVMFLIHVVFFVVLLTMFIPHYSRLYSKNSFFATLSSNLLLFGLADSLAQTITRVFSSNTASLSLGTVNSHTNSRSDNSGIPEPASLYLDSPSLENHQFFFDYDEDIYSEGDDDIDNEILLFGNQVPADLKIFNYRRLIGFIVWGFFISIPQYLWYKILNGLYVDDPKFITVLERVLADQLCYSPLSLAGFFYYSSIIMEGGNKATFKQKMQSIYVSTLAANYCVWPVVQFINFLVVPKSYQVPFSSTIGVMWNCFLSIQNARSTNK